MVLDDITERAGFFIKASSTGYAKLFCHRDLDAFHVPPIPNRLEEGIGKAKIQEVLNRFFAQVMVNPKDGRLVEDLVQGPIQGFRGSEIPPKWFFDHDTAPLCTACAAQSFNDDGKHRRRDGEIMQRMLHAPEGLAKAYEGVCLLVITIDVLQLLHKLGKDCLVDSAAELSEALPHSIPELCNGSAPLCHSDDRHSQMTALNHGLQGGKDFLECQVTGDSKQDERIGA
jgi:hypothetical protein